MLFRTIAHRWLRVVGLMFITLALFGMSWQVLASPRAGFPVPKAGQAFFGVQLDWVNNSINDYASRLGRTPALYGTYLDFPLKQDNETQIASYIPTLAMHKSTLMLTLEPWGGLSTVTPDTLKQLTADLRAWNNAGVPVLVRFAHEMDGSWYPWAQQPTAYVSTFRMVADAVHKTPRSGMLWAPNEGGGYPFSGGQYAAKAGTADFAALDTNHDGMLTMADDPYAPFYPGDQYVDWVGLSLYHFGNVWPWGENEVPEAGKLVGKLTGKYKSQYVDETALPDFYTGYAANHHKPMAIAETSALYAPGNPTGASNLAIKTAWMQQLFDPSLTTRFSQIKLVAWFEHEKQEHDTQPYPIDWRITADPVILDAFKRSIPSWLQFAR